MSPLGGLPPGVAILAALLCAALALAGCGDENDDPAPETETAEPEPELEPERAAALDFTDPQTVAEGLEVPWSVAFADAETILVTERPGRVRLIADGELRPEPVAELDVSDEGEGGLLGIALHPDFPEPRAAYLLYTAADGNRISRFILDRRFGFGDEEVLAMAPAASIHNGGQLAFGPDGLLYAATGDAGEPALAADPDSLAGKILRFEPGGGPAGAERFGDSPVLSYGHRNPQGFAWDEDGRLYVSEHGPSGEFGLCCHDEVNLVREGGFYGWPYVAGGEVSAQGGEPPEDPIAPVAASGGGETWAPAGVAVRERGGGAPAELLVANLAGERLMRAEIHAPRELGQLETELDDLGRLRAAVVGPDDCLYVTTSNTDGRGSLREGDDRLLRICPRD